MVVTCRQPSSQRNVTGYKMRQNDTNDVLLQGDLAPPLTESCNDEATEITGGLSDTEVNLTASGPTFDLASNLIH